MPHLTSIYPNQTLLKSLLALFAVIIFSTSFFAQQKNGNSSPADIFYSQSSNGSTANPLSTSNQPGQENFSAEKQDLLNRLRAARLQNDLVTAEQLRNSLDQIDGLTQYQPPVNPDPANDPIREKFITMNTRAPFIPQSDYYVTNISSAGCWGVATASSNRSSAIFAATSEYVNNASDNIRIYVSYNGGATWVLKYTYNGYAAGVDCRPGEIDIEPIISGNDTIVYCTVGVNYNNHAWSTIITANIGTGTGSGNSWSFGGYLNTNVDYYNPKVTSDNTTYTSATYVYFTSSFDSAGTSRFTTRFMLVTSPFTTSPVFTYRQPNAPNGFWWQSNNQTNAYLHQDICYYNNGTYDRVYTVYNHSGTTTDKTVYIAWSNDYGATVGSGNTVMLSETNNILGAVCAANGGTGRTTMAIGYRLFYGSGDYDYRIQYSSAGGVTAGSFTGQYMEYTTDTTKLISLQAIDLANGRFVTGYSMNGGEHFFRSFNGTVIGQNYQTNSLRGDDTYGGCRAGYWNSPNPDSSIVIWSPMSGAGAYCSRLMSSTVGIEPENNSIPSVYSLNQNYPNPFNPVTNIKFSIPAASFVKLVVYDVAGREVARLVDQQMNAGSYTVNFNASQLSSGVYFYRIDTDNFSDVRKMMLVK